MLKVGSMYGSVRLHSRPLNDSTLCKHIHPLAASNTAWVRPYSQSVPVTISASCVVCFSLSFHPLRSNSYSTHRAQGSQTEMQRHARKWEWVSVCACAFTLIYFTEAWETVTHTHTHWNVSASQWDSTCYLHNALCHLLSMPRAQHLLKEGSVKEWMCVCGCVCVCVCVCLNN